MKTYRCEGIVIWAYERGGYYVLRMSRLTSFLSATRKHGVYRTDTMWTTPVEKKFEGRGSANRYFQKVKESHSDLRLVKDEPGKYIDSDGEVVSCGK